jgi:hypothetical protein
VARNASSQRSALGAIVALASLAGVAGLPGCAKDFDTSRATPPRGTLGREMYTMVCDRVGAQALREDVTGASFHAVCHAAPDGTFADKVDAELLTPLDPSARDVDGRPVSIEQQQANRAHRIARIEALARRRDDLIGAFDTAFADETIAIKDLGNRDPLKACDPPSGDAPGEGDLRTQLADTLGRFTDLYNDDTIPDLTRALARIMDAVQKTPDAQVALARFDARRGYRPTDVAMGVARPALSYPGIVDLANALLRVLSSDTDPLGLTLPPGAPHKKAYERTAADRVPGKAHAQLAELLAVTREELANAKVSPDLPELSSSPDPRDPLLVRLSRPRGNLEIARTILLAQDSAFTIGSPKWVVARDRRGVAKVRLVQGKVPAPFLDTTGSGSGPDGLADLDELGQFLTSGPAAPAPFADFSPDPSVARDGFGRATNASGTTYDYVDVASTYVASLSRDLVPLLDPDPQHQHETLMDLLSGLYVVAGTREAGADSTRTYDDGKTIAYRAIREDQSPLVDLAWGVGQVFADPTTDDTLALLQRLAQDKPALFARMIGMGLEVKAVADKHPEAKIPLDSTLWDEMLDTFAKMAAKPQLFEDVIRAFGNDAVLDMPRSAAAYMTMRDHLTYDRNDLNGAPYNVNTGKQEALVTPVDRSKPDTGWNRSAFQRFIQALHETNGMSVCTKPGAVAHIVWNGLPLDFPSFTANAACFTLGAQVPPDPMPVCGMFRIEDIAANLVDAALGQVKLDIRDDCLRKLVDSPLTGLVGGANAFLENVSGINGWNLQPTIPAIDRMTFLDLPHDGLPGDTQNTKTTNFFRDLFDPAPTLVCPAFPFTDTDGHVLNLRQCASFKDTTRSRLEDALFPLETMGFIDATKPLAQAFKQNDANLLFVELFDRLYVHWGSAQQSTDECRPDLPRTDARWCSQDGAVSYEPLLAEALTKTDLFPALHDSVLELETIKIPHCDARDAKGVCTKTVDYDGVKVLAEAVKAMVDPAKNKGLKRRNGDAGVVRNDGTKNTQVTPVYLLIDALKGFDQRLADWAQANAGDDRTPAWRRARSQLVDQLFQIDGTGKDSKLHNPAVQTMLPILLSTLRAQIAANCPDPTKVCTWARTELPNKVRDVVTGPTFASMLDVADAVRADEPARTELEKLLVFLLQSAQGDAQKATLTAIVDTLQVLEDDANLTALLHAGADAAGGEDLDKDGHVVSRGLLLSLVEVLSRVLMEQHDAAGNRLCGKEIDPNRTLAVVLKNLVTPPPDGRPPPIDVLIDVAADVNRRRPEITTKLIPDDYASISFEVGDFCANTTRGLEQVYTVIKQATKDL